MTHDDSLASERLNRSWNALNAGRDPGTDATGRTRFIGEMQASGPAAPSRAARSRIWQAALARSAEEGKSMSEMDAMPPSFAALAPVEPDGKRVRAWRPALEFAAAAALILAVVGGFFAGDRFLSDGEGGRFAAVASPEAAEGLPPLGGGGASMSLPESDAEADGPLALSLWRLTVDAGVEWTTPDDLMPHLWGVQGDIEIRPVAIDEWSRIGRNHSHGSDGPVALRNQGSDSAVVDLFLLGYGDDVSNPAFPAGIGANELAGGFAIPLEGGEAFLSNETLQVNGGSSGVATIERDTGRDGVAVIVVEQGQVELNVVAGSAVTRPRGDDGTLLPADGSIPAGTPVTMLAGDSAVIHFGAAFRMESSTASVVTLVTIEQNTARAQGLQGNVEKQATGGAFPATVTSMVQQQVTADIPSPEECTIAPRSVESLERLMAMPIAGTPDAFRFQPGDGEPADAETVLAITATMREVAACYNAGDALRTYALYTDAALQPALQPGDVERARRGEPPSGNLNTPMPLVEDVRLQPDGRVTAKVDFNGEKTLIVFVRSDDGERWLIDLFNDQVSFEDAPTATPVP
ncbi:MAG: hypothetical protein ACRDJH_12745 [Thermomicrobiales bacterium]